MTTAILFTFYNSIIYKMITVVIMSDDVNIIFKEV